MTACQGTSDISMPLDLERYIFEIAAQADIQTACVIALVSRRSQTWMEQIIYAVVTLEDAPPARARLFLRTVQSRPHDFFALHVKSLCLPTNTEIDLVRIILTACTGLVDLAYWATHPTPPFPSIPILRPRRLSIYGHGLLVSDTRPDFAHPFFDNVTHVEFFDGWKHWTSWSGFEHLKRLTHLTLDLVPDDDDFYITSVLNTLRIILGACRSLLVCLIVIPTKSGISGTATVLSGLYDPRVVVRSYAGAVSNWEGLIQGDRDACQWLKSEDIIIRRSASIESLSDVSTSPEAHEI